MMHILPDFARSMGPGIANHLWQSTVFAVLAGVVALVLRKYEARVRYGFWLAASLKFLVPFSLLVGLGHVAAPNRMGTGTGFYYALDEVSQPFRQPAMVEERAALSPVRWPEMVAGLWAMGFGVTLGVWVVRWRRVQSAARLAMPLLEGREVDALREQERVAGLKAAIPLLLSEGTLEPGVFGVFRPVLLWPAGLSGHLTDAHLESILAHEALHVRRRDNLAAAIHMVVEAVFWFHPLAWWVGARMMEERERACDEGVVQMGSEPEVYAESILKACEFCVESPLSCVSGVTGSNLKKRIVRVMTQELANKLTVGKKMFLTSLGVAVLAGPVVFGAVEVPVGNQATAQMAGAQGGEFEVLRFTPNDSGKMEANTQVFPGGLSDTNASVKQLIEFAYDMKAYQLTGAPAWIDSARYDLELRAKGAPAAEPGKPMMVGLGQVQKMRGAVQALLADRFGLKVSEQTKVQPAYALVLGDGGPKLTEVTEPQELAPNETGVREPVTKQRVMVKNGSMNVTGPVGALTGPLSGFVGRQVIDQTGLKGQYEMNLEWQAGEGQAGEGQAQSISNALEQQLGLKLEAREAPGQIFVIDRIERPSSN